MTTKTLLFSVGILAVTALSDQSRLLPGNDRFQCTNGKVGLKSIATLELIQAKSGKLRGLIDLDEQTFAWSVDVQSFEGFNSPLQQEHFNENYMESTRFPKASFTGKMIEKVDVAQAGVQNIRAKGKLFIHGVEQERIIKCQLELKDNKIVINSIFTVPVSDHNIAIPKIVHQKIAEEIQVTVNAVLTR